MTLRYYGRSETGAVRERNEDALLLLEENGAALFLVADGIGGKAYGEIASGMLRDGYARWWYDSFLPKHSTWDFQQAVEQLRNTLVDINRQVVDCFGRRNTGSTAVILFFFRGCCAYLSAGDSRIYRIRGLKVQQMTRDDTAANLPGSAGLIGAAGGRLVGAVGISDQLEFSLRTDRPEKGDCFSCAATACIIACRPKRCMTVCGGAGCCPRRSTLWTACVRMWSAAVPATITP